MFSSRNHLLLCRSTLKSMRLKHKLIASHLGITLQDPERNALGVEAKKAVDNGEMLAAAVAASSQSRTPEVLTRLASDEDTAVVGAVRYLQTDSTSANATLWAIPLILSSATTNGSAASQAVRQELLHRVSAWIKESPGTTPLSSLRGLLHALPAHRHSKLPEEVTMVVSAALWSRLKRDELQLLNALDANHTTIVLSLLAMAFFGSIGSNAETAEPQLTESAAEILAAFGEKDVLGAVERVFRSKLDVFELRSASWFLHFIKSDWMNRIQTKQPPSTLGSPMGSLQLTPIHTSANADLSAAAKAMDGLKKTLTKSGKSNRRLTSLLMRQEVHTAHTRKFAALRMSFLKQLQNDAKLKISLTESADRILADVHRDGCLHGAALMSAVNARLTEMRESAPAVAEVTGNVLDRLWSLPSFVSNPAFRLALLANLPPLHRFGWSAALRERLLQLPGIKDLGALLTASDVGKWPGAAVRASSVLIWCAPDESSVKVVVEQIQQGFQLKKQKISITGPEFCWCEAVPVRSPHLAFVELGDLYSLRKQFGPKGKQRGQDAATKALLKATQDRLSGIVASDITSSDNPSRALRVLLGLTEDKKCAKDCCSLAHEVLAKVLETPEDGFPQKTLDALAAAPQGLLAAEFHVEVRSLLIALMDAQLLPSKRHVSAFVLGIAKQLPNKSKRSEVLASLAVLLRALQRQADSTAEESRTVTNAAAVREVLEKALTLKHLIGQEDPLRPAVAAAVSRLATLEAGAGENEGDALEQLRQWDRKNADEGVELITRLIKEKSAAGFDIEATNLIVASCRTLMKLGGDPEALRRLTRRLYNSLLIGKGRREARFFASRLIPRVPAHVVFTSPTIIAQWPQRAFEDKALAHAAATAIVAAAGLQPSSTIRACSKLSRWPSSTAMVLHSFLSTHTKPLAPRAGASADLDVKLSSSMDNLRSQLDWFLAQKATPTMAREAERIREALLAIDGFASIMELPPPQVVQLVALCARKDLSRSSSAAVFSRAALAIRLVRKDVFGPWEGSATLSSTVQKLTDTSQSVTPATDGTSEGDGLTQGSIADVEMLVAASRGRVTEKEEQPTPSSSATTKGDSSVDQVHLNTHETVNLLQQLSHRHAAAVGQQYLNIRAPLARIARQSVMANINRMRANDVADAIELLKKSDIKWIKEGRIERKVLPVLQALMRRAYELADGVDTNGLVMDRHAAVSEISGELTDSEE